MFGPTTRKEAEEAVADLRRKEREEKYGLAPLINRPTLQDLIAKRLLTITARHERTRSCRVLYTWLSLLDRKLKPDEKYEPANGYRSQVKVDEVDTPKIRLYVDRRLADGQSASSVTRELNIIGATLHQAEEFFSELKQWKSPRIPRPKVTKSRRERIITDDEYNRLVTHLRRQPDALDGDARRQNRQNAYEARMRVA